MLKNSIHKSCLVFFVLLIIYLVFVIPYSPLFVGLGYDKEIFQYVGMLIKRDLVPYKDVFDHKPPIIYVLNYLGFVMTPNSTWGIFIILNSIGFLSSILIYKFAKCQVKNSVLALLIAVSYICLIHNSALIQGGNLTRQFTAYLTVWIMYLVFNNNKTKYVSVLLGVLLGLIFFTQQNEILGGSILVFYYLFFEKKAKLFSSKKVVANCFPFFLGFGFSFLIIVMLIYSWDNYIEFINQAYLFNFNNYIQQKSIFHKTVTTVYAFGSIVVTRILFLIVILVLIYRLLSFVFKKKEIPVPFIVLMIAFTLQIISTSISGRTFGHYFLMFIPFLIGLFIYSIKVFINVKYIKFINTFLILSIVAQSVQDISYNKTENKMLAETLDKVQPVYGEKGQFYSFDATFLRVNFNLNIVAPSKWVYTHYMDRKMLEEIQNDIQNSKTRFILVKKKYLEDFPVLKRFLKKHYSRLLIKEKHILFERK